VGGRAEGGHPPLAAPHLSGARRRGAAAGRPAPRDGLGVGCTGLPRRIALPLTAAAAAGAVAGAAAVWRRADTRAAAHPRRGGESSWRRTARSGRATRRGPFSCAPTARRHRCPWGGPKQRHQ